MRAMMKKIERDAIVLEMNGKEYKFVMDVLSDQMLHNVMDQGLYIEPVPLDRQRELLMASNHPDAEKMLNRTLTVPRDLPDVYQ